MKIKSCLILALCVLSSCSPGYVIKAAYEQAKILNNREDIDEVIKNPATSEEERKKLMLVQQSRIYAKLAGLKPKNTFTKYTKLDKDVLSWVVIASKPDAFELRTWWFPIVGSFPYKGFFELEDAKEAGAQLEKDGYEIAIRPVAAFSTLGWFDDPLLSTTLKANEISIATTVLHESVHTTFWLKDKVEFNESLANYIGTVASCNFFKSRFDTCRINDATCKEANQNFFNLCQLEKRQEFAMAAMVERLFSDLNRIYNSDKSHEEKLFERELIFNKHLTPFRKKFPTLKTLQKINNAEIMQLKLYLSGFTELDAFYKKSGENFLEMLKTLEANEKMLRQSPNPFAELNKL